MVDQIRQPLAEGSNTVAGGQPLAARVPRDLRTLRRIATAISIVLAPLAVGVVRATTESGQDGKAAIAAVIAHSDMERVSLAAGVVASLLLPFAIVGLTRLVMRRAPVLGALGGSLALVGWALVPVLVTSDAITYEMAHSTANPVQLAALWDQLNGNVAVSILTTIFIVGHELGTVLLGIGLARVRAVPLWSASVIVIGILLHPVSVVVSNRFVDILAYSLLFAGCVAAARTVLTTPNDAWDLPPFSLPSSARTVVSVRSRAETSRQVP